MSLTYRRSVNPIFLGLIFFISVSCQTHIVNQKDTSKNAGWYAIAPETKPWTRWWWHGGAVTKEGITAELEAYQKAGLGGVEITPIYGVHGYEEKFVNYLSPEWMELLIHTLKEGERLGMGIDMATGTGWPFGGPWIESPDACKNIKYKIYELKEGQSLTEEIRFIQQPLVRAIGNLIKNDNASVKDTRKDDGLWLDPRTLTSKDIIEPIRANKNLQRLALDQVQFEKPLALQTLMAYSHDGKHLDLTDKVDKAGKLNWVAPAGNWKLYALFQGWHGKMVERAGPGGEGNVIDHFSNIALQHYLNHFDSAFQHRDIHTLRAFFNDSYEVDDARGTANWTPHFFDEFKKRRGYDLHEYLPALFNHDDIERNERILCDYRQTISELLLANFTQPWKEWAHRKSAIVRNQAHGSPANILDLYATVDIPEIEGTEPLRIKMASSAGNVTGKKLVSSESATWLNEHFQSNLGDIKIAVDRFLLNGVNHIFYHGTSYSPPGEPWPGWLFYAAVHLNPRNSLWKDFDALNNYVARCQSFLQNTTADNDVLLYYPIYDRFSTPGSEMIEHFDGIDRQFRNTSFEYAAQTMLEKGYTFDYISDAQIEKTAVDKGRLKTEGQSVYRTLVIPHCKFIPLATLKKIIALAENGASVIMLQGMPSSVAGFGELENKKRAFNEEMKKLQEKRNEKGIAQNEIGSGYILEGDSLEALLMHTHVGREPMVNAGINFIRKKETDGNSIYLISNTTDKAFSEWLPLKNTAASIVLYDPMNAIFGKGKLRKDANGSTEVYVDLASKATLFLQLHNTPVDIESFPSYKNTSAPSTLNGPWKIAFISGGLSLPPSTPIDSVMPWSALNDKAYKIFSGTAAYTTSFKKPSITAQGWLLDLGSVKESAEVFLNGESLGTLIGPTYQLYIEASRIKENNTLEIQVSNLMANRIAEMDRQHIFWKKFYNVNFPSRKPENRVNGLFDASQWSIAPSGLIGPVQLMPL